ncbi:transposase [Streptosporangium soli]
MAPSHPLPVRRCWSSNRHGRNRRHTPTIRRDGGRPRALEWRGSTDVGHLRRVAPGWLAVRDGLRVRTRVSTHRDDYLWGGHFWSPSYFAASCGGAPLSIIEEYIENQKRPG